MSAARAALDEKLMGRAIELAARGLNTTDPNPRVGCIIADGEQVLGEGWHERAGEAHAEIRALAAASAAGAAAAVPGATVYVTLEPCSHVGRTPPCADALLEARVGRVVCGSRDPNPRVAGAGIERLRAAGVAVTVGVLEGRARALNPGFFSRFERARPWIRLKLAMSLDARTAPAGGGRMWISGEASRLDVQHLRARSSAVLTGAGTVRIDDPRLDVRLAYGPWVRQPLKVLLDPALSCPPGARIFAGGPTLVFALDSARAAAVPAASAALERVPGRAGRLDLAAVVERLTAHEVNELLVECGPRLSAAFLKAELVDELILYVAPVLLGADAAPLAALEGLEPGRLPRFELDQAQRTGADLRLTLTPAKPAPAGS